MSDTALMGALLAVQGEAPSLQRDKINPAFRSKYLSLEALMEQVLPVLNKHGLVWITLPIAARFEDSDVTPSLDYRLVHAESGEAIGGAMPLLLAKKDPQGQGSAITYARRYALMAVLGLVADEDDDGNAASGRSSARSSGTRRAPKPAKAKAAAADAATLKAIRDAIRDAKPSEETVRLALTTAGVTAEGTVAEAIKGLTQDQATQLHGLLSNDANQEG